MISPGSIDTNDLSPNAGILGTQIADNTIQFRNLLSTDVFKIGLKGTYTFPSFGNLTHGTSSSTTATIPHNLRLVPIISCSSLLVAANNPWGIPVYTPWNTIVTTAYAFPYPIYSITIPDTTTSSNIIYTISAAADVTNLYLYFLATNFSTTTTYGTLPQTINYTVYANGV